MLNRLKLSKDRKSTEGFTIIEIMIVLAIAGLILLIVFLAVPALQRSSRNTSRKNDAARVSTAVSDFVSNNNGALPGEETGSYVAATAATDASTMLKDAGTLGQLAITTGGSAMAANTLAVINGGTTMPTPTDNELGLYLGDTCSGAALATGTTRQAALIYPIEQSGGTIIWSCISSL
jgi:prepilin-type N-terminal cleavage/methylation domain-containing protein